MCPEPSQPGVGHLQAQTHAGGDSGGSSASTPRLLPRPGSPLSPRHRRQGESSGAGSPCGERQLRPAGAPPRTSLDHLPASKHGCARSRTPPVPACCDAAQGLGSRLGPRGSVPCRHPRPLPSCSRESRGPVGLGHRGHCRASSVRGRMCTGTALSTPETPARSWAPGKAGPSG